MRTFANLGELGGAVGQDIGVSDWVTVSQDQIDLFAVATGDLQWIHVNPARAAAGPFGTTVAHGYLTLSLLPSLVAGIYSVSCVESVVNYGLNRVRFPHPVPAGARIRDRLTLLALTNVEGAALAEFQHHVEIEGQPKPGLVAHTLTLLRGGSRGTQGTGRPHEQ